MPLLDSKKEKPCIYIYVCLIYIYIYAQTNQAYQLDLSAYQLGEPINIYCNIRLALFVKSSIINNMLHMHAYLMIEDFTNNA